MFARMSSRRKIGFLESNDPILFNLAPQSILHDRLGDDIHRPLENLRQPARERVNAPKICEAAAACFIAQLHYDIDVGILALLASGRRPKTARLVTPAARSSLSCARSFEIISSLFMPVYYAADLAFSIKSGRSALFQSGTALMVLA